eukprot:TRINITY_DN64201_c0_g1_i1.p1 TRINITY_DN64201_c0_g1~~TRINITY_DN64201_c0_g1_i1.p1  ORF type:complete len:239 (-),score=39.91 TRINITY_DN64201_c0_g1_i1:381-1097(-)
MGGAVAYGCMCVVPPVGDNDRQAVQRALEKLDEAYHGQSVATSKVISDADAREQLLEASDPEKHGVSWDFQNPVHYGELAPLAFCQLLHEVGATRGQKLYDLGSGDGKLAILAWLLGLDVVGVELIKERDLIAHEALSRMDEALQDDVPTGRIQLIQGSFMDMDFSDASILYSYDLVFTPALKEGLARLARQQKPGTLVVTSRGLPGPGLSDPKRFYCQDFRKELVPAELTIQVVLAK